MDDTTKKVALTLAAGVVKKGLIVLGSTLATHGWINGNETETFVSVGMAGLPLVYSFWQDYGKAVLLSQFEVLKAKSLAQAAKLKAAGLPQVSDAVVLAVQRPPVARQLLHIVVDGVNQLTGRLAGLLVKDQVIPEASKLLEIGGNGLSAPFLPALLFLLLAEGLRGGSVFGFGHEADRIANGSKTHCAGFCAGGNRFYWRHLRYLRHLFAGPKMREVPENIDWRSRSPPNHIDFAKQITSYRNVPRIWPMTRLEPLQWRFSPLP